jgi:DNA repair exonuclease SbcCD ATPase subunit
MDLALLQQMKDQTNRLASNRRHTSDDAYEQGLTALARAQASAFEDKEALKQASECFIRAIQYGRQNVEAYVGMAYLLILLGDHVMAVRYLNEGRRIDPRNQDILTLTDYIQNPDAYAAEAAGDDFALVALDGEDPEDDLSDALFEEVQRLIQAQLAQLRQLRWDLALTPPAFKALEDQYASLDQARADLNDKLAELELDFDTASLRQQLRPLESAINKLQGLRQASSRLLRTQHEIKTLTEQVQQDVSLCLGPSAAMEQKLEKYLDECDRFADLLDQTETQGYSIALLEPVYARLVSTVEQLQDLLDA